MSPARMRRGYRLSYIGRAKELFRIEKKAAMELAMGGAVHATVHSKTSLG